MGQFDKIVNRSRQCSAKYEEMESRFGRSDLTALWIADMDFAVSKGIANAVKKRGSQKIFGYTARPDGYFESLCAWYAKRHAVNIDKSALLHSPGVVTSVNLAINYFTKPGDGIIVQPPVYFPFFDCIGKNNRRILENPLIKVNGDYTMNFAELEILASKAAMLILCNPHNPVGRVWRRDELEILLEICARNGVRVVSDEIHGDLVFDSRRYTSTLGISGNYSDTTITLLSATKTFNIAGLHASFVIAPNPRDYRVFDDFFELYDLKRNNCFSQVAVEAAFRTGESWLEEMLGYVRENMRYVKDYCGKYIPECVPNMPEGTYLQWVDCTALGLDDTALNRFMIHEARIASSLGIRFGANGTGHVRLNLACPRKKAIVAMRSIENAVIRIRNNKHKGDKS